ncbi:LysR family transcriptional regulator [Fretibacter rubidus]|uniref:LysR family transcriptional regulator n=1 Tax=Fretibacter rubidus TaxID=570162 RepID=UPI00352B9713
MSRYEELEAFVRTIESGSFTAAAKQLRVAKSAISRRISELEARLGTQLIIRTTRKLSLTESGQALFQRATMLLSDWEEAEGAASQSAKDLSGRIRIAAPLSFGISYLGAAIIDFTKNHPDVSFDIDFSDRKVDLVAEGMDLAVRIGDLPDSGLIARKVAPIRTVVTASPDYLKDKPAVKTPEDLQALSELRYSGRAKTVWTYKGPHGQSGTIELPSALTASNGDFLRDAAVAGLGVTIQPIFILCDAIDEGTLVELLPDYRWSDINAYAVYPPTRHLSVRVRAFVDFLVARYSGIPPWELEAKA